MLKTICYGITFSVINVRMRRGKAYLFVACVVAGHVYLKLVDLFSVVQKLSILIFLRCVDYLTYKSTPINTIYMSIGSAFVLCYSWVVSTTIIVPQQHQSTSFYIQMAEILEESSRAQEYNTTENGINANSTFFFSH